MFIKRAGTALIAECSGCHRKQDRAGEPLSDGLAALYLRSSAFRVQDLIA